MTSDTKMSGISFDMLDKISRFKLPEFLPGISTPPSELIGGENRIIVSDTFHEHPTSKLIIVKILVAIQYFPEINPEHQFTVFRMGHVYGSGAKALVDRENRIGFNVTVNPSMNTIFHELGHVLHDYLPSMPYGEEACSIYALSRMPLELVESNVIPYLGIVPRENVPYYCQLALDARNKHGIKHYIKFIREKIAADKSSAKKWPSTEGYDESTYYGHEPLPRPQPQVNKTLADFLGGDGK